LCNRIYAAVIGDDATDANRALFDSVSQFSASMCTVTLHKTHMIPFSIMRRVAHFRRVRKNGASIQAGGLA
jgi:hypothetical protein